MEAWRQSARTYDASSTFFWTRGQEVVCPSQLCLPRHDNLFCAVLYSVSCWDVGCAECSLVIDPFLSSRPHRACGLQKNYSETVHQRTLEGHPRPPSPPVGVCCWPLRKCLCRVGLRTSAVSFASGKALQEHHDAKRGVKHESARLEVDLSCLRRQPDASTLGNELAETRTRGRDQRTSRSRSHPYRPPHILESLHAESRRAL